MNTHPLLIAMAAVAALAACSKGRPQGSASPAQIVLREFGTDIRLGEAASQFKGRQERVSFRPYVGYWLEIQESRYGFDRAAIRTDEPVSDRPIDDARPIALVRFIASSVDSVDLATAAVQSAFGSVRPQRGCSSGMGLETQRAVVWTASDSGEGVVLLARTRAETSTTDAASLLVFRGPMDSTILRGFTPGDCPI